MSYEVIARKWRPKSFNELIGQNHVSQTLVNALKNDRLPQALLFNGPRGTGKTSSARIFASTLRCPNIKDFSPCGTCAECNEISSGKSVNVIEVDGASNNGVESIRELRDSVNYLPPSGKYKIYIIDEVHMLSTSAFNALLKTLEEPPAHVIFIMATTELHKVPNTILSRCQKFDFRRVSSQEIVSSLENICTKENIKFESEALWNIARQADGSMRDSQSLLDQVISFCDNNIQTEQTVEALGLTDRKWVIAALTSIISRDHDKILNVLKTVNLSGQDPNLFIKDLLQEIRNTLICKLNPEIANSIIDLSNTAISELETIAASLSEEDLHLLFDMTLKGAQDVTRSSSTHLVLEMLLLRLASAPRIQHIESMTLPNQTAAPIKKNISKKTVEVQPQKLATPPTPAPKPVVTQKVVETTTKEPVTEASSQQEQWNELVTKIETLNPVVAAKLKHSYLIDKTNDIITVGISPKMKFLTEQVKDKEFVGKIQNYVATLWGKRYNFEFQEMAEKKNNMTPNKLKLHKEKTAEIELRNKIENHPIIKKVHDVFKTEIVSIKDL